MRDVDHPGQNLNFTALIADDEKVARDGLRLRLDRRPEVNVVGECRNGLEVVDLVSALKPDLLFLDVQMPGLSGFDALAEIDPEIWPAIVFVTAFEQHALRAFEVNAVDYLLKPFDDERFERSFHRALEQLRLKRAGEADSNLTRLVRSQAGPPAMSEPGAFLKRILVRNSRRAYFVPVADIDWIESARNYVRLHVGRDSHLVRWTINNLADSLDPTTFVRIHRATIVNLTRIREILPEGLGCTVVLSDGTRLAGSRHYRRQLLRDV
jgi:two-component system, LytTR family, response regulator